MRSDDGSATLAMGVGMALFVLFGSLVVRLTEQVYERSVAQSAADAAALAGALHGTAAATKAAAVNKSEMVSSIGGPGDFTATVRYRSAEQSARAQAPS